MLETLDQVDWAALDHAYGSAADVPEMVRALLAPDAEARAQARSGLHASLDHQGVQRFESTWRAVPFLVELLADPATPERGELARLLAELAVGDTCWFLHDGVHRERQMNVDNAARAQHVSTVSGMDFASRGFPKLGDDVLDLTEGSGLRWIYDAVAAGVPTYVAALAGADDELRAALPFLCAFLTGDAEAALSAPALTALLDDPVEAVRASAALGLSHATKFVPALRAQALTALTARWAGWTGPLERRCLALSLTRFENPAASEPARAYLREELGAGVSRVRPGGAWPWFRIDSPPFLFCTTYLGSDEATRDGELRGPASVCLTLVRDTHDAADLAVWLARLWGDHAEVQRALVASPAAWHFTDLGNVLRQRDLPAQRDALAATLR
jgi:hypothetical protein